MVVALGPGKFYGSSLPRPRFYTDVKLNGKRVDPPVPVMDALMTWAEEAHWSMGGLNFMRHRLQGRIEGNVEKLRVQRESIFKKSPKQKKSVKGSAASRSAVDKNMSKVSKIPSSPPAPIASRRRRVVGLLDEEEEVGVVVTREPVRKLGDDFETVARESRVVVRKADESGGAVPPMTRSKSGAPSVGVEGKSKKGQRKFLKEREKVGAVVAADAAGIRTSPRLAKHGESS